MTLDLIFALLAFAFVASITPGPNNLMLMASGLNYGVRQTFGHLMGVWLGFLGMMFLIGIGLKEFLDQFPMAYTILKIISLVLLCYLAYKIATAGKSKAKDNKVSKPISFIQAVAFQWTNPKAWVMCLTAVSAYTGDVTSLLNIALVVVFFGIVNLPCIVAWVCLGTQLRALLNTPLRLKIFNYGAAALLLATLIPIFLKA